MSVSLFLAFSFAALMVVNAWPHTGKICCHTCKIRGTHDHDATDVKVGYDSCENLTLLHNFTSAFTICNPFLITLQLLKGCKGSSRLQVKLSPAPIRTWTIAMNSSLLPTISFAALMVVNASPAAPAKSAAAAVNERSE